MRNCIFSAYVNVAVKCERDMPSVKNVTTKNNNTSDVSSPALQEKLKVKGKCNNIF